MASPTPAADRGIVRAALAATGLSQVALAELLGVEQSTMYRWVHGRSPLDGPTRFALRALALDPSLVLSLGTE